MRKIYIKGKATLKGEVQISGSKNAALPILAATILLKGECTFTNVPHLLDIITIIRMLRALGIKAEYIGKGRVKVSVNNVKHMAPYELVTKMRASFFVIGPILVRNGLAKIPLPGGCAIGSRPVNLHLKGLEALGAKVKMEHGFVIVQADKLRGGKVYLDFPSVGATETVMMAATLASGTTVIENAAKEPEIIDLANFLIAAGAKIKGAGTEIIEIEGVGTLHAVDYPIIPDRIEAGTFMVAAAATSGDVFLKGVAVEHLEAVIQKLKEAGSEVQVEPSGIRVKGRKPIKPLDIKTLPFPGFPTDMQAQFAALLACAEGTSVISETVFENRFMYVHELNRMGANIRLEGQSAILHGVPELSGAPVMATDLRAGAALAIAALMAEGETEIIDTENHIARGYENLIEKFKGLGVSLKDQINGSDAEKLGPF
ncbi:MAG: UDP-N-acetylglucosamine 1-carboxyvinyltransferase [Candidatus Saganbacteria bacterium]|nr:UDP-N-acetylglucosamine 1-carboxyvinyltransferase [Candidatus Saganbacteria bacterium]